MTNNTQTPRRPRPRPTKWLWMMGAGILCLMAACLESGAPVVHAREKIGILIVGDTTDPGMTRLEQAIISRLIQKRDAAGLSAADLPIMTYHYNKREERARCQSRLGINRDDLLFVGLAKLSKGLPVTLITSSAYVQVSDADLAATQLMNDLSTLGAAAQPSAKPPRITAGTPSKTPGARTTPAPRPTVLPTAPPQTGTGRVIGVFEATLTARPGGDGSAGPDNFLFTGSDSDQHFDNFLLLRYWLRGEPGTAEAADSYIRLYAKSYASNALTLETKGSRLDIRPPGPAWIGEEAAAEAAVGSTGVITDGRYTYRLEILNAETAQARCRNSVGDSAAVTFWLTLQVRLTVLSAD